GEGDGIVADGIGGGALEAAVAVTQQDRDGTAIVVGGDQIERVAGPAQRCRRGVVRLITHRSADRRRERAIWQSTGGGQGGSGRWRVVASILQCVGRDAGQIEGQGIRNERVAGTVGQSGRQHELITTDLEGSVRDQVRGGRAAGVPRAGEVV